MKTIIVLLAVISAGAHESHTYSFRLPADCEPGALVSVSSQEDFLAVGMRCVRGPDGKGFWRPAERQRSPVQPKDETRL